jgi:hypothetical protein
MDPAEFSTFADARAFLADELACEGHEAAATDVAEWDDTAAEFHETATLADGYVYWVHRTAR